MEEERARALNLVFGAVAQRRPDQWPWISVVVGEEHPHPQLKSYHPSLHFGQILKSMGHVICGSRYSAKDSCYKLFSERAYISSGGMKRGSTYT